MRARGLRTWGGCSRGSAGRLGGLGAPFGPSMERARSGQGRAEHLDDSSWPGWWRRPQCRTETARLGGPLEASGNRSRAGSTTRVTEVRDPLPRRAGVVPPPTQELLSGPRELDDDLRPQPALRPAAHPPGGRPTNWSPGPSAGPRPRCRRSAGTALAPPTFPLSSAARSVMTPAATLRGLTTGTPPTGHGRGSADRHRECRPFQQPPVSGKSRPDLPVARLPSSWGSARSTSRVCASLRPGPGHTRVFLFRCERKHRG